MPIGRIRGRHGEVRVPSVGAVVGRFDGQGGFWELTRREAKDQQPGKPVVYRFSAVLSYLGPLYSNERLRKEIVVRIGSDLFRVDPAEGQRMELKGRTLQSEGVTLWPLP